MKRIVSLFCSVEKKKKTVHLATAPDLGHNMADAGIDLDPAMAQAGAPGLESVLLPPSRRSPLLLSAL